MIEKLPLSAAVVREIRIAAGSLTVIIETPAGESRLFVEGRFTVRRSDGTDVVGDATHPETVGVVAGFAGITVRQIGFGVDGTLSFELSQQVLSVPPSPDHEAWDLDLASIGRWICMPGGRIAEWSERSAAAH